MMMPIAAAVSLMTLLGSPSARGRPPRAIIGAGSGLTSERRARCRDFADAAGREFASKVPFPSIIDKAETFVVRWTGRIMPRRASKPADSAAERPRRRHGEASGPGDPAALPDLFDIGGDALAPELREAIGRLAGERDRLREELARARSRIASLERLADEDALTPVANRRAFVRQLTRMIGFCHRYGIAASVVYFDVNNMKQINDVYGHPAGDAALRRIATALRDNIRSSDIVGRLGGDEFGVILAQTDEVQAGAKAASLAEAIAATPLHWAGGAIPLSVAYGVHAFSRGDNPQQAIEAADRAMYEHKRTAAHSRA
jgi:diguanylate cyclase (GGDEF)-like protein